MTTSSDVAAFCSLRGNKKEVGIEDNRFSSWDIELIKIEELKQQVFGVFVNEILELEQLKDNDIFYYNKVKACTSSSETYVKDSLGRRIRSSERTWEDSLQWLQFHDEFSFIENCVDPRFSFSFLFYILTTVYETKLFGHFLTAYLL